MRIDERVALAMKRFELSDGEKSACRQHIEDAIFEIEGKERKRLDNMPTTREERKHAAKIVDAVERLEKWTKFSDFDFGSPFFNFLLTYPASKMEVFKAQAKAIAEAEPVLRDGADASRKRAAVECAVRIVKLYSPKAGRTDIERSRLASILIGEPTKDLRHIFREGKKLGPK